MKIERKILWKRLFVVLLLLSVFCLREEKQVYAEEHVITVAPGCGAKEIQEALDANANGQYDKLTVKIPAGTYELNTTLYIYSNTTIEADTAAILKKMDVNGGGYSYGAMLEGKLIDDKGGYGNCHDIAVIGGIWDSVEVMNNSVGTESFRFIHCDNVTVKDVVLCNVPAGSHLLVLAGTSNAVVEDCEFYGYGTRRLDDHKEAIQLDIVHNVEIVPTFQNVMWDDLPCRNVTIKDCFFHNFSRGIGSHTAVEGVLHDNVTISDNTFLNMSDTAIKLFNYENVIVENNRIMECAEGILVYTDMASLSSKEYMPPLSGQAEALPEDYNILIRNNSFQGMRMDGENWGDAVRIMGSTRFPIKGVKVLNNDMQYVERYGIFASNAQNVMVTANQADSVGRIGIYVISNCKNITVLRNRMQNCGGYGIYVSNSQSGTICGNTVKKAGLTDSSQLHGIYVYNCSGTSSENAWSIQKNVVEGNEREGSQGICVNASNYVSITGNVVRKTKDRGIFVDSCEFPVVEKNRITEAGVQGTGVIENE